MKTLQLATSLLLLSAAAAPAQVFIQGTVVNTDSAKLAGARIEIADQAGTVDYRAITDSLGRFTIRMTQPLPAARYFVRAEMLGYRTTSAELTVENLQVIDVTLTMDVAAIPLEPLRVAARRRYTRGLLDDYYDRAERVRRLGGGTIIDYDQLQHQIGSKVEYVVASHLPGSRRCPPAYFIDGMRATAEDLRMLTVMSVEGIEIYRSSAHIPPMYQSRTGCAVVLIWTQVGDRGEGTKLTWRRVLITIGLIGAGVVLLR
ncbi:MAG TPA: carboxypeptidase-like regulatory domain-containing protein [Longimicrobiales bacterium]